MFEKLRKIFKNREEKEKHNYDLTFDNVAIPEVHVKSTESHEDTDKENAPISYDNVGIQSFLGSLLFRVFRSGSSVGSFSRVWF